jgi:cyclophilin family peptidyl-prolyl cis-trans isomerase
MPITRLLARLLTAFLVVPPVAFLSACGEQRDSTPAVSVLGILDQSALAGREIVPFQVQEVSQPDRKTASYTYEATGLPTGLSINRDTGLISGKPIAAGTFGVTVTVSNTKGSSSRRFTWTVFSDGLAAQRINGQIQLIAGDTASLGSVQWCFKAVTLATDVSQPPAADDACWQGSRTVTVAQTLPIVYAMWSRTSQFATSSATVGPCSQALRTAAAALAGTSVVCMQTSAGEFGFKLEAGAATATSEHFLKHANSGFYDGTVFHRILAPANPAEFAVAQGGNFNYASGLFTEKLSPFDALGPQTTNVPNAVGSIALSKDEQPAPGFRSRFSINLAANACLDSSQAACPLPGGGTVPAIDLPVFGSLISGDLSALAASKVITNQAGEVSLPQPPPVIYSVWQIQNAAPPP